MSGAVGTDEAREFTFKTQTGRVRHDPRGLDEMTSSLRFLLLFFLYFDNFAALIKTAVGTDGVRKAHGTAVRAGGQVAGLQSIVCAAHVAAALRVFALWMWGHETFSFITCVGAEQCSALT